MTQDKTRLLGVVLSGGRSQRMGYDKALISIDNADLLEHVYKRLYCQFEKRQKATSSKEEIIISTNNPLLLAKTDKTYLADDDELTALGPLSGIFTAMKYAKQHGYHAIITIAVDTPFFPQDYVKNLYNCYKLNPKKPVLSAYQSALQPTFGLWPIRLVNALKSHLHDGKRSIYSFAQKTNGEQYDFANGDTSETNPFFNVNTPEDLQVARELWI